MKKYLLYCGVAIAFSTGCEFSVKTNEPVVGGSVTTAQGGGMTGAIIKNDIEVEAENVKVSEVYLMTPDRQFKEGNDVEVDEQVILTVKTDTGWTKINGKSFVGISERITDSEGKVILDGEDLFSDYDAEGVDATTAKLLNATAVITQKDPNGHNDFTVSFKMWDKKGPGIIKGKYLLHVK